MALSWNSPMLIPGRHKEPNQIRFTLKLPINGKALSAFVFLDVFDDFSSTCSAELWAQRQLRCGPPDSISGGNSNSGFFLLGIVTRPHEADSDSAYTNRLKQAR
jgi:hypothetical protein